jgi:uncharacterized protein YbjT (DUF2867 family)
LIVLVTGAGGTLGQQVISELIARAHSALPGGRPPDLSEVEAVIHCATDPRHSAEVDLGLIRHIATNAERRTHLIYPGIVGCDLIPLRYYRSKTACEAAVAASGLKWTILRATQFHQLLWGWYTAPSANPWLLVPASTRYQPLDPTEMARRLVDAVETGPGGRVEDMGGPLAYDARELARSAQIATGSRRRVITYNKIGIAGAALRAGANLTPHRAGGETWNEFAARQMAR